MRIASIFLCITAILFSQEILAGNIKEFHIQLELTAEANKFIQSLSDDQKQNWQNLIPDSIPLKATAVLQIDSFPMHGIGIKIGTFEGLGDIFQGRYLPSDSTSNPITHFSSGNIHYLTLGNIVRYKKFIALAWMANFEGMPIELARFEKN